MSMNTLAHTSNYNPNRSKSLQVDLFGCQLRPSFSANSRFKVATCYPMTRSIGSLSTNPLVFSQPISIYSNSNDFRHISKPVNSKSPCREARLEWTNLDKILQFWYFCRKRAIPTEIENTSSCRERDGRDRWCIYKTGPIWPWSCNVYAH